MVTIAVFISKYPGSARLHQPNENITLYATEITVAMMYIAFFIFGFDTELVVDSAKAKAAAELTKKKVPWINSVVIDHPRFGHYFK